MPATFHVSTFRSVISRIIKFAGDFNLEGWVRFWVLPWSWISISETRFLLGHENFFFFQLGDTIKTGRVKVISPRHVSPEAETTNCTLLPSHSWPAVFALFRFTGFFFAHLGRNTNQKWHSERCQKTFPPPSPGTPSCCSIFVYYRFDLEDRR